MIHELKRAKTTLKSCGWMGRAMVVELDLDELTRRFAKFIPSRERFLTTC
jgi:hypothetical protein